MDDTNQAPDAPKTDPVTADATTQAPDAPVAKSEKRTVRRQSRVDKTDPVTAVTVTQTVVKDEEADALPSSVKMAAPYAFYEDDGSLRSWSAGQIIEDAEEIALLVVRGAVFEAE